MLKGLNIRSKMFGMVKLWQFPLFSQEVSFGANLNVFSNRKKPTKMELTRNATCEPLLTAVRLQKQIWPSEWERKDRTLREMERKGKNWFPVRACPPRAVAGQQSHSAHHGDDPFDCV